MSRRESVLFGPGGEATPRMGAPPGVPRLSRRSHEALPEPRLVQNRVVRDRLVQAIVLVEDLGAARVEMEALGLTVLDGGRHPGRGTANLIVPFGAHYLELLAVVDEGAARASQQGRPVVAALSERGPGLARWSVEAADIEL